jgi:signal transduction histidine kinase
LSTFARIAWGIVRGFVVLHGVTGLYYGHDKMVSEAGLFAASVAERGALLAEHEHTSPELVALLESSFVDVTITSEPTPVPSHVWPHTDEIRDAVVTRLHESGFTAAEAVRVWYAGHRGDNRLFLQLPLANGWLQIQAMHPGVTQGHSMMAIFWTTVMGVVVLLAVLWSTRRVTGHLPQFALAAAQVGRDMALSPLPEKGPKEVRRVSEAFNAMQRRVTRLLEERNSMLGALSHDVRTLVTRLALRLETLEDDAQREKAEADIAAITSLLDDALVFAREDASEEAFRELDLPSLLQSLLDDERALSNRDVPAHYLGPDCLTITAQPGALRRAFANLISNAVRYGGGVTVELRSSPDELVVDVIDPGPGIPVDSRELALKPYVRLESSRNRDTGGSGLGLAIAASVIRRHQGSMEFIDQAAGFTVRVRLKPLSPCFSG